MPLNVPRMWPRYRRGQEKQRSQIWKESSTHNGQVVPWRTKGWFNFYVFVHYQQLYSTLVYFCLQPTGIRNQNVTSDTFSRLNIKESKCIIFTEAFQHTFNRRQKCQVTILFLFFDNAICWNLSLLLWTPIVAYIPLIAYCVMCIL